MGSQEAVLSAPSALDMVPLGEDLQGRSNQGVKAFSDTSDRYISDSGTLKGVLPPNWKKAWSSVEPKPSWSSNTLVHGVKDVQGSPVTLATDCSLSNKRGIYVQGHMLSGLESPDFFQSAPPGIAVDLPTEVKNICPPRTDKDAAFIRRLENLPPDQESQNAIPYVKAQQKQQTSLLDNFALATVCIMLWLGAHFFGLFKELLTMPDAFATNFPYFGNVPRKKDRHSLSAENYRHFLFRLTSELLMILQKFRDKTLQGIMKIQGIPWNLPKSKYLSWHNCLNFRSLLSALARCHRLVSVSSALSARIEACIAFLHGVITAIYFVAFMPKRWLRSRRTPFRLKCMKCPPCQVAEDGVHNWEKCNICNLFVEDTDFNSHCDPGDVICTICRATWINVPRHHICTCRQSPEISQRAQVSELLEIPPILFRNGVPS